MFYEVIFTVEVFRVVRDLALPVLSGIVEVLLVSLPVRLCLKGLRYLQVYAERTELRPLKV